MKASYEDITSRIQESPTWYDEDGVPRYGKFSPEYCPDIYTNEVFLIRIACQDCGERFDVEMHSHIFEHIANPKELHYGDPPIHGCVGDTMNCEDLEILEAWHRKLLEGWARVSELEGDMDIEEAS